MAKQSSTIPAATVPREGSPVRTRGDELPDVLAYVRGQLRALCRAMPAGTTQYPADTCDYADPEVVDLAEPLQRLVEQPQFRRAFREHFRDTFGCDDFLPGVERLCEQLAPACAWSMLFLIATLDLPAARTPGVSRAGDAPARMPP